MLTQHHSSARCFFGAALALALAALFTSPAAAFSPTDPKVRDLVSKARECLSKAQGGGMGQASLIALGLIKSDSTEADPKVQEGIAAIRNALQSKQLGVPANYHVAIALIFLCETDPVKYRPEIQALLDILLSRQESHGGWSYGQGESNSHGREAGDSSQCQYVSLALWEAKVKGFNVPQEAVSRLADFWMRTQTPEGAWGYQGKPAPQGQRINQAEVRLSIAVAGLGSCYVIGDLFNMGQRRSEARSSSVSSSLQKVEQKAEVRNFPSAGINADLMRQTMQLGDRYIDQTYNGYAKDTWIIYYMYAMERYRSFQENYTGKSIENAKWYDDGVDFLAQTQHEDGSWQFHFGGGIDTAFAVMFLTRSTKRSIEREYGQGLVRGGRGLPEDISQVAIDEKTGNAINPEAAGTVAQLMAILEDPNNKNFDAAVANSGELVQALVRPEKEEDVVAREQRLQRLKDMVSKGSYQQRRIAVKALGRTGDMDNVPLLLFALTDQDAGVQFEADAALRFVSRKLQGFGPPDANEAEVMKKLQLQWRQWYLALRPDAELLE